MYADCGSSSPPVAKQPWMRANRNKRAVETARQGNADSLLPLRLVTMVVQRFNHLTPSQLAAVLPLPREMELRDF